MWIFGPLPCSTISPVTVTPASACASVVTESPSTSSTAGSVTVSPACPVRRLTVNVSPTPTLCCVPPALTTAYTTDSSIGLKLIQHCVLRTPRRAAECWTGRLRTERTPMGPSSRSNPTSVPESRGPGRTPSGDRRSRRSRCRPATPGPGHRRGLRHGRLGERLRRDDGHRLGRGVGHHRRLRRQAGDLGGEHRVRGRLLDRLLDRRGLLHSGLLQSGLLGSGLLGCALAGRPTRRRHVDPGHHVRGHLGVVDDVNGLVRRLLGRLATSGTGQHRGVLGGPRLPGLPATAPSPAAPAAAALAGGLPRLRELGGRRRLPPRLPRPGPPARAPPPPPAPGPPPPG